MTKICSKCKIEKDIEDFYKHCNKNGYYYRSECKICSNLMNKIYREKHEEEIKKYSRDYWKFNKENLYLKNRKNIEKNKDKISEYYKQYFKDNKEEIEKYKKEWYMKNKERCCEEGKRRYESLTEEEYNKRKLKHSKYMLNKMKTDICYKLRSNVSNRIRFALRTQNSSKRGKSIFKYLPYSINQLKYHLESQFEPWMNWENYGRYEKGKLKWQIDHITPQSKLLYDNFNHPNFQKCWALENLRPLEVIENIKKRNK